MSIVEWAVLLGISTAMIPGPLMALVVTQTLSRGTRAGIIVACAPLITDTPIILLMALVLRGLPKSSALISGIGICGAAYLVYLAARFWTASSVKSRERSVPNLDRAVLSNFLNPGPYIFWGTIGGTVLREQVALGWMQALVFPVAYYAALVGMKIITAVVLGKGNDLFRSRSVYLLNRVASLSFLAFAVKMLHSAIPHL